MGEPGTIPGSSDRPDPGKKYPYFYNKASNPIQDSHCKTHFIDTHQNWYTHRPHGSPSDGNTRTGIHRFQEPNSNGYTAA